MVESAFMGNFFSRELIVANVIAFLTLKHEFMSMVADMRSKMSLFVAGLYRLSSKEGKAVMLIGDMDIARLMIRGMSPGSRRVMRTVLPSIKSKRNLLHHLLVHLHQGTKMNTIVRIHSTSELDLCSLKVEGDKLRDKDEFKNKKAKTGNESEQQKSNANRYSFHQRKKGLTPSSA
ncbi:hypothetical protein H5410_035700, partial [Solanum commersonii]